MSGENAPAGMPRIAALAFSDRGMDLGERLRQIYPQLGLTRCGKGMLGAWSEKNFPENDALIYIGAAGIAVRGIAPLAASKMSDPAVIVIDELGRFVIPLLSGHVGGANALASEIAEAIDAVPVITTATDINRVFAVDTWAVKQGLAITNPERIKYVSSSLLAGRDVRFSSPFSIAGSAPEHIVPADDPDGPCGLLVTWDSMPREGDPLRLTAPVVTLGIGCRKGISSEAIEALYQQLLTDAGVHPSAVRAAASISLKANEEGLLAFCEAHGIPLKIYSSEELAEAPGEYAASEFVRSVTGVDNVCERAAVLGALNGALEAGDTAPVYHVLKHKTALNGVTMAIAMTDPRLSWD